MSTLFSEKVDFSTKNYGFSKIFLKTHNFWSKNRLFQKKGLKTFKHRVPPSWDPSQMKELILSFLNQLSLTCGKLWKKSCGILKWGLFSKIFMFFENFIIMDHLSELNTRYYFVNITGNNNGQFWINKTNLGFILLSYSLSY